MYCLSIIIVNRIFFQSTITLFKKPFNIFMELELSADEIAEYITLAKKFAKSNLGLFLHPEYADGNPERLPEIIKDARDVGLLSNAENRYGIWGYGLNSYPDVSLSLLSIFAEVCAGVAMCFHQNGLAFNLLHDLATDNADFPQGQLSVAIQEDSFLPAAEVLIRKNTRQPVFKTMLRRQGKKWLLFGAKHFVYSIPGTKAYLVFAQEQENLAAVVVSAKAQGVRKELVERRLGLLACRVEHLTFDNVQIDANSVFLNEKIYDALVRALFINWLGISAIATGTGKGALEATKLYIHERYQGGTLIENHPAIQGLVTSAEVNLFSAGAQLNQYWQLKKINMENLRRAAMMKLSVTKLCSQAVSDSLQCFGGYGYMEDYGMEKRFRDVNTMKSMAGTPLYLKRVIFELGREE